MNILETILLIKVGPYPLKLCATAPPKIISVSKMQTNLQPRTQKKQSETTPLSPQKVTRMSGFVKFFNVNKGYGFIIPEAQTWEVFVHHTAINGTHGEYRTLSDGENVEFDVMQGPKGIQAANVVSLGTFSKPVQQIWPAQFVYQQQPSVYPVYSPQQQFAQPGYYVPPVYYGQYNGYMSNQVNGTIFYEGDRAGDGVAYD